MSKPADWMIKGVYAERGVLWARVCSPAFRNEKRPRRVHGAPGHEFIHYHGERVPVGAGYIAVATAPR